MKLSIITINYNNASGLEKTLQSVSTQTCKAFEHVVVDGGSSDGSADIVRAYADSAPYTVRWVSERDSGIYNAMNKGICMATGDYIQILNSGDCLASDTVVEQMSVAIESANFPSIFYGNMLKTLTNGTIKRDKCFAGQEITFLGFYTGTLNHSPAYIRRSLFEKYGYYDESLRIVSDWKWYLQAIILGDEKPVYTDIDVTLFDMTGISETNLGLRDNEKKEELKKLIPATILKDYDDFAFPIEQIKRLKRHKWAYKIVWFIERCLFKMEKWQNKRKRVQIYR